MHNFSRARTCQEILGALSLHHTRSSQLWLRQGQASVHLIAARAVSSATKVFVKVQINRVVEGGKQLMRT